MRARFISQPNEKNRLGDILNEQLSEAAGWVEFRAAVAFGKRSGLSRLATSIENFLERGSVKISIGVDMQGTSKEGLQILLDSVVSRGGAVWVFRNEHAMRPTFHPKIYLFKKPAAARLIVGSGNLTAGGLYSNYEAGLMLDLNLENNSDVRLLEDTERALDTWCATEGGLARQLNEALLEELIEEEMTPSEVRTIGDEATEDERRETSTKRERRPLFGRLRVPGAPPIKRRPVESGAGSAGRGEPSELQKGNVVWRKTLSRTDAQHQPGHAVGGIRLTQAHFEDKSGDRIDQTTYFRYVLFHDFGWSTKRTEPLVEEAIIPFDVTILGNSLGVVELSVSHKPSGEAGQGNYTSILHWGELAIDVRERDLTGQTLTLYGPPSGERGPFFIDIT